jgi:hypothetical protein
VPAAQNAQVRLDGAPSAVENVPATQSAQAVALGDATNWPAGHAWQALAPVPGEKVPAPQTLQAADDAAPVAVPKVPAAHCRHVAGPCALSAVE